MTRFASPTRVVVLTAVVVAALTVGGTANGAVQDDGGSKRDAGNTFAAATRVTPRGLYDGSLDAAKGDRHDFYKFFLAEGAAVSILVNLGASTTDPVTILDPAGNTVDVGTKVAGLGLTVSSVFTSEAPTVRVAVQRASMAGEYRVHVQSERFELGDYSLCFANCEGTVNAPTDLIFGGSLPTTFTKVLLVPPTHGDLGNPLGPTVVDYIDATLRGIRSWNGAINAFTKDFPRYSYLRKIKIHIDVFEGVHPVDPALYDVIIGYAAAGPAFRGVASDIDQRFVEQLLADVGLESRVRFTGRAIVLSLFGSSPRVGQVLYDFPEINDLEIVTAHEFGHTFGLGHTRTWHPKLGPDLMNSPAPFLYGDGFPAGDGRERTQIKCLSTINLYGMAVLYRWIPKGKWVPSAGQAKLPKGMPYKWYC